MNRIKLILISLLFLNMFQACNKGKEPPLFVQLKDKWALGKYSFYLDSMYYYYNNQEYAYTNNNGGLGFFNFSKNNGHIEVCRSQADTCLFPTYPKRELWFNMQGDSFAVDSVMDYGYTLITGKLLDETHFTGVLSNQQWIELNFPPHQSVLTNLYARYHVLHYK